MRKFDFIFLAAGLSKRMGQDKALLEFKGKPWIAHQISEVLKSNFISDMVVIANETNSAAIARLIQELPAPVTLKVNPVFGADLFSSLLIGLESLSHSMGVFVSPVDVPQSAMVIDQISAIADATKSVIVPRFENKKGHPVLLLNRAMSEVKNHTRLDHYIQTVPENMLDFCDVNNAEVIQNLNTPGAWARYRS